MILFLGERKNRPECRVAPVKAMTAYRVKDTSVQPQFERDKTVANNGGGSERSSEGLDSHGAGKQPAA